MNFDMSPYGAFIWPAYGVSVIALVAYALLGWGADRIVWLFLYRPRETAAGGAQSMSNGR